MARFDRPIEPMTLGSMRELGVRSLDVSCRNRHHQAVLSADRWPDDVAVPTFGPRMVSTGCGIIGAGATVQATGAIRALYPAVAGDVRWQIYLPPSWSDL
jgi:hypothetical protein